MDYQLLPSNEEPEVKEGGSTTRPRNGSDKLSWAAIFVSILCLAVNLLNIRSSRLYTFPSSTSFPSTYGLTRKDIDKLRRPSQFIGFDMIHRNATPAAETKSFANFPMMMAQIDASQPHTAVTKPRKGVMTTIGTVYPELSDMVVSPTISTIVQFRALDYGMERCELSIIIPTTGNSYPLILPPEPLQVFSMAYNKPLYGDSLSFSKRPMRGELVGTPLLIRNTTWTHTFACLMDEIYTFEVACGRSQTGDCSLRWTQDKEHESFPAILMTQFSTI